MRSVSQFAAQPSIPADLSLRCSNAYGMLASEYYLYDRHPTCGNFDVLQDSILSSFKPHVEREGTFVEVGCGRGRLDKLVGLKNAVLTDISESMLLLAQRRTKQAVRCERMNVFRPQFVSGSIQGVFAFLADGYNHPTFFQRTLDMLAVEGCLVLTLPNHVWARTLRAGLRMNVDETAFIHRTGQVISAPSITRELNAQREILTEAGFRIDSAKTLTLESCPGIVPSPHVAIAAKRLGIDPRNVPLLDVFVAFKGG